MIKSRSGFLHFIPRLKTSRSLIVGQTDFQAHVKQPDYKNESL